MKKITYLLLLLTSLCFSQKEKSQKIGQVNDDELKMKIYKNDSLAVAVVLYEHANTYLDEKHDFDFRTDYYYRLKILNKEGFNKANIQIALYKKEKIKNIKAVTYNLENNFKRKTFVKKENIFNTKMNEYWSETKFTLPNIKEGSIIEYTYSIIRPHPRIDDWYFQSDIPKVKSEIDLSIIGNYKYNIRIKGELKLDKNNPSVKKNCLYIPGLGTGHCSVVSMGMNNVPAFKEEDYMLSKKNFISRLMFDYISFTSPRGQVSKYTKTWKDADKTLRLRYLDGQTSKKNFFKNKLPEEIINIEKPEKRAQKIYQFLQEKLTWNNKNWTSEKLKIKKSFEEGSGSVDAINLILYNSLQAANIESYIVALSTRENGLPTKLYPMVNDFNYIIVKAIVNGKSYFLDATDKNLSFGQIPFKCLNGDGRILDFKKGSYWEEIKTKTNSSINTRLILKLNDLKNLQGKMQIKRKGYFAINEREKIKSNTKEEYLDAFEAENPNIETENYNHTNLSDNEKPLIQNFDLSIEIDKNDVIRLNPFFYNKISENPFKLKTRNYPVDYGYKRSYTYAINLTLPENYTLIEIPKDKSLGLPNKGGSFIFKTTKVNNKINLFFKYTLNKKLYSNEEYHYLKEYYNQIIKAQESNIIFKKNKA